MAALETQSRQDEVREVIRSAIRLAHDHCHQLLDLPLSKSERTVVEVLSELMDLPDGFTNSCSWRTGGLLAWDAAELQRSWTEKLSWRLRR